jgi:hypothetical protein
MYLPISVVLVVVITDVEVNPVAFAVPEEEECSTLSTLLKKLLTSGPVAIAVALPLVLALRTGPPGMMLLIALVLPEDEETSMELIKVVVVVNPDLRTEVVVTVNVVEYDIDVGHTGSTKVDVRPSEMTTVVDCADAVRRRSTVATRRRREEEVR